MVSEFSWIRDFLESLIRGMDPRKILCIYVCAKLLQSCPTLCDPVACSLRVSSVHEVHEARVLGWVAMPSSRGSSQLTDQTSISCISCIGRQVLYY